jgi:hypothetical protein
MTERARQHRPDLLAATRELVDEVERCTGVPLEIEPSTAIRGYGRAVFVASDPDPSRQLILYDPLYERFLDHHVAHECGHVVRFATAVPNERMMPVRSPRSSDFSALEADLAALLDRGVPERAISSMLPVWLKGIVAQLSNGPADIHIERWLHREFPKLRDAQRASTLDQIDELHRCLGADVRELTPEQLWLANNAMNHAFVSTIAQLVERPSLLKPYRAVPEVQALGTELLDILDASDDTGHACDRRLTDGWAERLGLRSWYEWRRLDELPQDRRHAWGTP